MRKKVVRRSIGMAMFLNATSLAFSAPAHACRYANSDIDSLKRGLTEKPSRFSSIVVVSARWVFRSNRAGWRVEADVVKSLRGRLSYGFTFGRSAQSSCRVYPAPRDGDRWVIYFWLAPDGSEQEWAAHPLAKAAQFDPVYGAMLKSMLTKSR